MGLLKNRLKKHNIAHRTADDVLLFHSMMLMSGVDGKFNDEERTVLRGYLATLPDFQNSNFETLVKESQKLTAKHGGLLESIPALMEGSSDVIKRKCFILAADLSMAKGEVNDAEDQLLETMQHLLRIEKATAEKIIDVLAMKYER